MKEQELCSTSLCFGLSKHPARGISPCVDVCPAQCKAYCRWAVVFTQAKSVREGQGACCSPVPTRLSPVVSSQPLAQGTTRDLTSSPV